MDPPAKPARHRDPVIPLGWRHVRSWCWTAASGRRSGRPTCCAVPVSYGRWRSASARSASTSSHACRGDGLASPADPSAPWRWIHRLAYVAGALVFLHALLGGSDFSAPQVSAVTWFRRGGAGGAEPGAHSCGAACRPRAASCAEAGRRRPGRSGPARTMRAGRHRGGGQAGPAPDRAVHRRSGARRPAGGGAAETGWVEPQAVQRYVARDNVQPLAVARVPTCTRHTCVPAEEQDAHSRPATRPRPPLR